MGNAKVNISIRDTDANDEKIGDDMLMSLRKSAVAAKKIYEILLAETDDTFEGAAAFSMAVSAAGHLDGFAEKLVEVNPLINGGIQGGFITFQFTGLDFAPGVSNETTH